MNRKLISRIVLLVIFLGNIGNAVAEPALVYISPATMYVLPGQSFNVTVYVNPQGGPLAGMQANFYFDPAMLRLNNVTNGDLFSQNGAFTFPNAGTIDNTIGRSINTFEAIIGPYNVVSIARFAILNFTVIGSEGTSGVWFDNVKIASPEALPVAYVLTNGSVIMRVVSRITVSPSTKTLSTGGKVFTLSALCQDQNNAPLICGALNWSSDNITVANVNATTGRVTTGLAAGIINITATKGFVSDPMVLTVEVPRLNSITVSPASKTLSIGANQSFSAMCLNQFSAPYTPCTYTWSTSNSAVASFNATTRKALAVGSGVAYINATSGSVRGFSIVTVP